MRRPGARRRPRAWRLPRRHWVRRRTTVVFSRPVSRAWSSSWAWDSAHAGPKRACWRFRSHTRTAAGAARAKRSRPRPRASMRSARPHSRSSTGPSPAASASAACASRQRRRRQWRHNSLCGRTRGTIPQGASAARAKRERGQAPVGMRHPRHSMWSVWGPWRRPSTAFAPASVRRRSSPPRGWRTVLSFVHLHVHSHYSVMRGVDTLEALAQAARERGMDRFALTDTNALYGFVFYRQICAEAGLTPIAGAEVVEAAGANGNGGRNADGNGTHPARAVLLAR